jgi:hypothetical protein
MRNVSPLVSLLMVSLSATGIVAQTRPDFSGRWILVESVGTSEGSPLGRQGAIAQDSATLVFTETLSVDTVVPGLPQPVTPHRVTFQLDGSESRNTLRTRAGENWILVSQARWVRNELVITTTTSGGHIGTFDTTMTCSLDTSGNLVIGFVQPAITREGIRTTVTSTLTYKKT